MTLKWRYSFMFTELATNMAEEKYNEFSRYTSEWSSRQQQHTVFRPWIGAVVNFYYSWTPSGVWRCVHVKVLLAHPSLCYKMYAIIPNMSSISDIHVSVRPNVPVVLYGCETWSLTLREEHRLRVFENSLLRRVFGLKRDEVTGSRRKLHNEELHNLHC
jgi:hypothetical protein